MQCRPWVRWQTLLVARHLDSPSSQPSWSQKIRRRFRAWRLQCTASQKNPCAVCKSVFFFAIFQIQWNFLSCFLKYIWKCFQNECLGRLLRGRDNLHWEHLYSTIETDISHRLGVQKNHPAVPGLLEGTTASWSRSALLRVTGMLLFTPTSPSIRQKITDGRLFNHSWNFLFS